LTRFCAKDDGNAPGKLCRQGNTRKQQQKKSNLPESLVIDAIEGL
jgi:hypothetical protein